MLYTINVIDDAERTLVIILAGALAILIVMALIAVFKIIQLINILKRVADKAEHVADAAESISAALPKALSSLAIGKIIRRILRMMMNKKHTAKGGK